MENKRMAGEAQAVDALEHSSVAEVKAWIKLVSSLQWQLELRCSIMIPCNIR